MHTQTRKLAAIAFLCVLPFLLSGCYLQLLFGYIGQEQENGEISIGGDFGSVADCDSQVFNEQTNDWEIGCSYKLFDEEGFLIDITSSAQLIDAFGIFGVFIDPLIVQVPDTATDFAGDMNKGFGPQFFAVTETTSFKAAPNLTVNAEPGHKFIIVEFPTAVLEELTANGSLAGNYTLDFGFRVPSVQAFDVKPMYTVLVEQNGAKYYVPMLPCKTDFAQVPAITIYPAGPNSNLMLQILAALRQNTDLPCQDTVYNFGPGNPNANNFSLFLPLLTVTP